jgi:hypothetical protein
MIRYRLEVDPTAGQACREIYARMSRGDQLDGQIAQALSFIRSESPAQDRSDWFYRARLANLGAKDKKLFFMRDCRNAVQAMMTMTSPTVTDNSGCSCSH